MTNTLEPSELSDVRSGATAETPNNEANLDVQDSGKTSRFSINISKKPVPNTPRGVLAE